MAESRMARGLWVLPRPGSVARIREEVSSWEIGVVKGCREEMSQPDYRNTALLSAGPPRE